MKKVLLSLFLALLVAQNASAVPSCGTSLMPAFTANQATQLCKTFGSAVSQSIIPSADNTYDLGSASKEWANIYVAGNIIDPTITKGLILGNTSVPTAIGTAGGSKPGIYTARTTGIAGSFHQEYGADAGGAFVGYAKTRAATAAGGTIVQSGDVLGQLNFYGDNGTTYDNAAIIKVTVGGTPGSTTDMPGAMDFLVAPDGSATPASALSLSAAKVATFGGQIIGRTETPTVGAVPGIIVGSTTVSTDLTSSLYNIPGQSATLINDYDNGGLQLVAYDGGNSYAAYGYPLDFLKTRSTSATGDANTIVQSGDRIAEIGFLGANGSTYKQAALIKVTVDGTPGAANDMPGAIDFLTSPDGSATPASVLKLDNAKLATFTGAIKSTANVLGWQARAGANTACTTTCGAGKGCAFGFDIATTAVVDCSNAIADSCICSF